MGIISRTSRPITILITYGNIMLLPPLPQDPPQITQYLPVQDRQERLGEKPRYFVEGHHALLFGGHLFQESYELIDLSI